MRLDLNAPYRAALRRMAPLLYRAVNAGWFGVVTALCHPDVVARIAGDTPLSGTYTSRAAYRTWFGRVAAMCALHLTARDVRVTGTFRSARLEAVFADRVTLRDGAVFDGSGRHVAELRWGRIASITYDWDTETVQAACDHAAELDRRGI